MNPATVADACFDGAVSAGRESFTSRAAFDAFFALWLPRVHRFVARRLPDRAAAEAATRAILEAAVRARLVGARGQVANQMLAIAKAEVASRLAPRR